MADALSDSIVISSNRYDDLQPYCNHLYKVQPALWGAIFPWEFPQNGTREEEENFLRGFFSDTEIHMQGGAHGEGHGFRFLKQVWYTIALYNLEYRIPAFTNMWLAKPSSLELLNDANMQPFLFDPDVKASTYFAAEELEEYGVKFLSVVVPYLQQVARQLLEAKQTQTPAALSVDTSVLPESADKVQAWMEAKTAEVHEYEGQIVNTTVSLPPQDKTAMLHSTEIPGSAPPFAATTELPAVRNVSNEQPIQQSVPQPAQLDIHPHPRKRGNSGARRFSNRGNGPFRQSSGFNERNAQMYPSPSQYGPTSMPMHNQPRLPSGGPMEFMPSLPQGQSFPPMQHQGQYMAGHIPPHGYMQQMQLPPNAQYYESPPPSHINHPFADRTNVPMHDRGFAGHPSVPYFEDPGGFRGGHRRNSRGSQGGKPRGNFGNRGRGSRGRNSFHSLDQPPYRMQDENAASKWYRDVTGPANLQGHRRDSIVHEPNWRSGSDNPQKQHVKPAMHENMVPAQQFFGASHPPMEFMPHQEPVYYSKSSFDGNVERNSAYDPPALSDQGMTHNRVQSQAIDPRTLDPEQKCGRDWIGGRCVYARRLIVFDVPEQMPHRELQKFFSSFSRGGQVSRGLASTQYGGEESITLAFINFPNAEEARKCLLNRPGYWLDNRPLRLEVSKQFWDPTHIKYVFGPNGDRRGLEGLQPAVRVSSILRRSEESTPTRRGTSMERSKTAGTPSTNTTPTPSGASTPKKRPKAKQQRKKEKDNLRMASIAANAEQHDRSASVGDQSDAASIVTTIHRSQDTKVNAGNAVLDELIVPKQRSASEQTERQTTSEPAFSPVDVIETRLPDPEAIVAQPDPQTAPVEGQRSSSGKTEVQTTSEPTFSLTDNIVTRLPMDDKADTQPFRDEEKATEKTKSAAAIAEQPTGASAVTEETATPSKSDDGKIDDSFHTASDSPGSIRDANSGKEGIAAAYESATVIVEEDESSAAEIKASDEAGEDFVDVSTASAESPLSVKGSKKVHVPQSSDLSKVTVNTGGSVTKPTTLEVPQRSTSADSAALPTPAYFTAPNTPAVVQESPKEAEEDIKPDPPASMKAEKVEKLIVPASTKMEKEEKPKGPAHTESFSLFGKKKEKKPKGGKKGTLKGKPKSDSSAASDIGSGTTSRVVSTASTPNPDVPIKAEQSSTNTKKGGEKMSRSDSKFSDKATKAGQETEKMAEDLVGAPPAPAPQQETPSKLKGLGGLLSGIFGGGQASLPSFSRESKMDEASKNSLTGAKVPDRPLEKEVTEVDASISHQVVEGKDGDAAPQMSATDDELSLFVEANEPQDESLASVEEYEKNVSPGDNVGLGIFTADRESALGDKAKSKKKPKQRKKGKRKSNIDGTEIEQQGSSTPASESKSTVPEMYRFGEDMPAPSPTSGDILHDDRSDASSHTLGHDTPSPASDLKSPTVPTSSEKKLPSRAAGQGHLVEAKSPMWKKHKRRGPFSSSVSTTRTSETMEEAEEDDERVWVTAEDEEAGKNVATATTAAGGKIYVYLGPGARDEDGDEDEGRNGEEKVKMSKEQMVQLAREEHGRRFAGGADDPSAQQVND